MRPFKITRIRATHGGGRAAVLAGIALALLGCVTNPYTERSQFNMLSLSEEIELSSAAYFQTLNQPHVRLSQDRQKVAMVRRVAGRIIDAAKKSKYRELANQYRWDVNLIEDDETANAFAMTGGKVAMYTGILPITKNEDGLAAVLGHEMAHALARHGGERISQRVIETVGLQVAAAAVAAHVDDVGLRNLSLAALGLGAYYGVLLPYSRAHESEADYIGLLLAA